MILITLYSIINQVIKPSKNSTVANQGTVDLTIIIKGMTCNHCKETATEAIQNCDGIEKVVIDLKTGNTLIYGKSIDETQIVKSINSVGFSVSKLS